MRIGVFAKKHGVSQDTIRYYIQMGLLVSEKNGGHYRFNENDGKDLEKIIELKELNFSLTEVQKILGYQRLSGINTNEYRKHYISFLREKKDEILNQQEQYNKMFSYLDTKIDELENMRVIKNKKLGFPLSSINVLQCPLCKEPLNMTDGTIDKNVVVDAKIFCNCGYRGVIEDGVYIDPESVREKVIDGKPIPTKQEYLEKTSHRFINFLCNGVTTIIDNIGNHCNEPKYIMELGTCVGFFLMQYIKHLPKNSTYILIDYDKQRISNLKSELESHHDHNNFIFLCCDYNKLPIAYSSVDIMIDLWATKNYAQANREFLPEVVMPILRRNGLFFGAYHFFHSKSQELKRVPSYIKDYLNDETILLKLLEIKLKEVNTSYIGPVKEWTPYNIDYNNKELYQLLYVGEKI